MNPVALLVLLAALLAAAPAARAQVILSEFMADNQNVLEDEDGAHEDWIEVWNTSTQAVDMTGWSLTDKASEPHKWNFPTFNLAAGTQRVVFASSKNRRNPLAPLHTNFKLDKAGEYLALVRPDASLASVLNPYPPQVQDVAYGVAAGTGTVVVVPLGAPARWQVPVSSNEYLTAFAGWTNAAGYDDSWWSNALTGVGYDTGGGYNSLFGAGGNSQARNYNVNGSIFLRIPFSVTNRADITSVRYASKHDDGFIVWLNGQPAVAEAAPASPTWNSLGTLNRDETLNTAWTYYLVSNGPALLSAGTNMLAIQGFNVTLASSDLLIAPQLEVGYGMNPSNFFYLTSPTPGWSNAQGSTNIGPMITGVTDRPPRPLGTPVSPSIVVTARVDATLRPLATNGVQIGWRLMHEAESYAAMSNAGGDVYVASIPTTNLAAGQMVRWRIIAKDASGVSNTAPRFVNALDNDQYYGTVALDPSTTNSRLPILYSFCSNYAAAATAGGTRCALFFLDNFYDNVEINLHGQTSSTFPKKPYDFDFNDGNRFLLMEGEGRVKDVNLLTPYADKTKSRNVLAHEIIKQVGAAHLLVSTVRVQTNAAFAGLWDLVEDGDNRWLERLGLNANGALYKIYNFLNATGTLTGTVATEKKWPQDQAKGDLQALIDGIHPAQSIDVRRRFAYDHVDLAACVSYLVARSLIGDQDHGHKNYYVYCDSGVTDEWSLFPWDIDLSLGHNWTGTYYDDALYQNNVIKFAMTNWLYQLMYDAPELNQMVLRRHRTVMERILQPPGTPTNELVWERRMDERAALLDPPGITNSDAILDWQKWGTWAGSTNNFPARTDLARVKAVHPPGRRDFLFNQNPLSNGQPIPGSQPAVPSIVFGEIDPNPASGSQDAEYFTVRNTNTFAVDLSGWSITGGVSYTFRPGTVLPAGGGATQYIGQLHVARSPRGFRARTTGAHSNEYRFIVGPYAGQLSARGESIHLLTDLGAPVASAGWAAAPTPAQLALRVTEIMYDPAPPRPHELAAIPWLLSSDFEFIELKNIGTNALSLGGARLAEGVSFTFPTNFALPPGALAVVAANTNALALRYGAVSNVAGTCDGLLDNAGERLQVLDPVGEVVQDFTFNNTWVPLTAGFGFSLVPVDAGAEWDAWDHSSQWRRSAYVLGSPGADDPVPPAESGILITEALAHTDPPQSDTIELFNPTDAAVDLGGWFLTDDFSTPKKYRIPPGTVIASGACALFSEADFNTPSNLPTSFSLSSTGDDAWLFAGDAATNLTGYYCGQTFGASPNGHTFVRHLNSVDEEFFVLSVSNALGSPAGAPLVGPGIIAEIGLATTTYAFVEVENRGAAPLALYDPLVPTNTWRLRGQVDFDWPAAASIPATSSVVIVGFDPAAAPALAAAFRGQYGLGTNVALTGPWTGSLNLVEGHVKLLRPDSPNSNEMPYILVEDIHYRVGAPWPAPAAGQSLQRIDGAAFGSDPMNWFAAPCTPGAGAPVWADADADGQPDWAEQLAGTDASNAVSLFGFLSPTSDASDALWIRWPAGTGRAYIVECSSNLIAADGFVPVATNVAGAPPVTSWPATNSGYYRLRLRHP